MLKAPTVISLCALLCLYGCGQKTQAVTQQQVEYTLSQPIAAEVVVKTPELTVEGVLNRTGPEVYSFEVTAPQQLEGLRITAEQQNCTLSYRGMEGEVSSDLLASPFAPVFFNRAVDALLRQQQPDFGNTPDGGAVVKGSVEGVSFRIEFDSSGRPSLFAVPEYETEIVWKQSELSA